MFNICCWNQYSAAVDGIARTTNSVEGWHYSLQALFMCNHPTMWKFLDYLRLDMTKQKMLLMHGAAGAIQPAKKKYLKIKERVERTVASYGQTNVVMYLKALSFLSFG